MDENNTFNYTYSAKEQVEIQAIREKYVSKPEPSDREKKLERLHKLDAQADRAGTLVALFLCGLPGITAFALGMCCVTAWAEKYFDLGVVLGSLGLIAMAAALPLSRYVTARKREQIAPEVLKLIGELEEES